MPPGIATVRSELRFFLAAAFIVASLAACACASASERPTNNPSAHWAFQPVAPIEAPAVQGTAWIKTPIDRFILARLEAEHLRPAPVASREQLLRRVYFDLLGLPPTPADLDAFVADRAPDAWPRLVDRLLASPHYGERWARHWLDVVRFGESDGFEHDAVRPNAWRYRDYVIRSLNADKPYDRFVREQIAGDELWPEEPDAVIATAFHLLGPDMVDSADQTQRRLLTLSDMTDITATAFLGLTMGCARCHDHKLEPFTQADYYSLQAYFAPAQFHRDLPVPTATERLRFQAAMADYNARTGPIQKQLSDLETPYRERLREERLGKMSADVQLAHRTPREKRTPEQESSVLETGPQLQITDPDLAKALTLPDRQRRAGLLAELKKDPKPAPLPLTLALQNTNGAVPITQVLLRGDYNSPAHAVDPAIPACLRRATGLRGQESGSAAGRRDRTTDSTDAHRRAALAQWMTDPANPLTARVIVNRVWQHHFGRGLVATPNDFGTQGARPTHPELVDWLARELVTRGWSLKALHRLILLSATYQQSSEVGAVIHRADPDNRLLARQNRLRLEGEALRDSLLLISGQLNPQLGGPSVQPPIAPDIVKTSRNWTASQDDADHRRRSIYIFSRRNLRFPFLEVFDAPDSNLSCPERGQSTTAPQSLTLLNSREVTLAARQTARRLAAEAAPGDARIERAFRWILARRPDRDEVRAAREFVQATRRRNLPAAASAHTGHDAANLEPDLEWIELCRALFNLNDFVYVN